jgi:hypothetical protein
VGDECLPLASNRSDDILGDLYRIFSFCIPPPFTLHPASCILGVRVCVSLSPLCQVTYTIVSGNVNYGPRGPEPAFAIHPTKGEIT